MTKMTKSFIIIFSSIFIGSFFVQRAILDIVDWSNFQGLLLALVISGTVAAIITPLLTDTNNRKRGILFLGLYVVLLVAILFFFKGENFNTSSMRSVGGVWETKERDGENFMLDFFKRDSLRLIMLPELERVVGYKWKGKKLQIYDEEEGLLFDWNVRLDSKKMIIIQGDDKLVFYKIY